MTTVAPSHGTLIVSIKPSRVYHFHLSKRSAAMISLKGPIHSPIIHCSFQCGPGLEDLRVCECVLHNSYWTRLEDVDYSLNILLHLPERERASRKEMKCPSYIYCTARVSENSKVKLKDNT
jgi:hypothetical protein